MKGKGFLKVTGILMIIGGGIGIIVGLIAVLGVAAIAALGASSALLTVAAIFSLVSAIVQLIAGIIGVKNCQNPAAAQKCIIWGAIVAALSVLGTVLTVAGGGEFSVVSLLLGLVLPALYIVGAVQNGKQA